MIKVALFSKLLVKRQSNRCIILNYWAKLVTSLKKLMKNFKTMLDHVGSDQEASDARSLLQIIKSCTRAAALKSCKRPAALHSVDRHFLSVAVLTWLFQIAHVFTFWSIFLSRKCLSISCKQSNE